jgi:hypothetical protein
MRWLLRIKGSVIVEHVVQRPTIRAVLPPVAALSDLGPDRRGVPSSCHAGRALAASDGHSNRFGPATTPLEEPVHTNRGGWVEGWISPCGARPTDPVPGCGGPERWRRPRPDGTGATPKASAGSSATSGPRASGRQRTATVTRGPPSSLVNASPGCPCRPWERSTRFHTIPLTTRRCAAHCPPGRPLAGSNGRSGQGLVGELVASATCPAWQAVGWSANLSTRRRQPALAERGITSASYRSG